MAAAAAAVLLAGGGPAAQAPAPFTTWSEYGGTPDSAQYSALAQINKANVRQLQVAWTYATGDPGAYIFGPLVVDNVMYVLAKNNAIVALDAATGRELWVHENPKGRITQRGINYWESKDRSERRLLYMNSQYLQALDAKTGEQITTFGQNGRVDLRVGLDRDPATINVQSGTPGKVFEDLIVLGSATNQEYASAPGDVRAFDVRTGALVWTFHTVPRPGEFGYETWPPDAWKTVGGANAWGELSIDAARGIVYVPTGSPKYNFYGGNRKGANLFGDSLLALDARTGKRVWHFQMVHHDIWDYDNATAPKLLTVRHNGQPVDVVAQAGKTGFLYVFNRVTGEPLWPIEERPVPQTDVPGEQTWPTQPFPTKPAPFARQAFTEKDLSQHIDDPAERERFLADIRASRNEGLFTPVTLNRYTMQIPGNNGGANFGGAAIDPAQGTMFVVSKDWPALLQLVAPPGTPENPADPSSVKYRSTFGFMVASNGLTAIQPPWTSLTAYDLNEGTIKWRIPLGEVSSLAAKGVKDTGVHFPKIGPVVTAGGLLFAGTRDQKVRAFDVETGAVLWDADVPAGAEGIPAVYQVNGKQYVVFCVAGQIGTNTHVPFYQAQAGGGNRAGGNVPIAGSYIAFALPD
ncbi:MAG: pyrroloquinoline quinone-dependent dehydrogenase [Acidobacteria bacterium]|nr:pyrroloquinoline quinone-dependent dehydrogenase [Acidobacteriota bacterium]